MCSLFLSLSLSLSINSLWSCLPLGLHTTGAETQASSLCVPSAQHHAWVMDTLSKSMLNQLALSSDSGFFFVWMKPTTLVILNKHLHSTCHMPVSKQRMQQSQDSNPDSLLHLTQVSM